MCSIAFDCVEFHQLDHSLGFAFVDARQLLGVNGAATS
jgi:hypothetical protein